MRPTEGEIRLKGRAVVKPGPDRMMVFQEFDQLLPWKTVMQNVMFPLQADRPVERRRRQGKGDGIHREGQPHQVRRQLSAHALGRHEAARGDCARHGDGAGHPADGRAVRCARCAHARTHAGRIAGSVGRSEIHGDLRHPFHRRGGQDRQPHSVAFAASRPGQGGDQQRATRRSPRPCAARSCNEAFTTCCLPTRWRRSSMSEASRVVRKSTATRWEQNASASCRSR